jgi:hypothetical protein
MRKSHQRVRRASHGRRPGALVLALAMIAAAGLWASPAHAQGTGEWLRMVNDLRSSRGLAPLQLDANLSSLAQRWSEKMAADGAISHDPNLAGGVTADWTKLGENVGTGTDRQGIWQAFLNSPPHLANLVDPQFTHIGIGTTFVGDREFVVHRFMAVAGGGSAGEGSDGPEVTTSGSAGGFGAAAPRASTTSPPATHPPAEPDPAPPSTPASPPPPAEPGRVAAVLEALRDATG